MQPCGYLMLLLGGPLAERLTCQKGLELTPVFDDGLGHFMLLIFSAAHFAPVQPKRVLHNRDCRRDNRATVVFHLRKDKSRRWHDGMLIVAACADYYHERNNMSNCGGWRLTLRITRMGNPVGVVLQG